MRASKFVKKLLNQKLKELHVALPAKIENYDPEKMIAEVTLLNRKELQGEEVTIPKIIEVPVAHFKAGSFIIRPPYKPGNIVQVLFNERALDKLLITGDPESVEYKRKHSLDDAVVIKGLKIEQENKYPAEEANSLYISHLLENNKIIIRDNGDIRLVNEGIDDGELIKENFAEILIDNEKNIEINQVNPDSDIDVSVRVEKDGTCIIEDKKSGSSMKLDTPGSGDFIFNLANQMLLGDDSAGDPVVILSKILELVTEIQSHTHPSHGAPPPQTFTTNLGSEVVKLTE